MRVVLTLCTAVLLVSLGTAVQAEDCVDVELGAQVVPGDMYDVLQLFFSLENCGTEPGEVELTVSLDKDGTPLGSATGSLFFGAGESVTKELELPLLPFLPAGDYTLCVTATIGTATDEACATITLDEMMNVISFSPDGDEPTEVDVTWGGLKAAFR